MRHIWNKFDKSMLFLFNKIYQRQFSLVFIKMQWNIKTKLVLLLLISFSRAGRFYYWIFHIRSGKLNSKWTWQGYCSRLLCAIITCNHLPFFGIFSNFVHFCLFLFNIALLFFWTIASMSLLFRIGQLHESILEVFIFYYK